MESIELINHIKSSCSGVYHALTTQEGLSQIWTTKLKVNPEIGFINEFDFNEGYITKMKVVDLQKYSKIIWKCIESDKEWTGTGVSFDLSEKDGMTTVVLKHYNWNELTNYYRWCNYNWAMFLFRLKKYCEEQEVSS